MQEEAILGPAGVTGAMSPVRQRIAHALCALAAVLLALGTLAGIANRQLVDGARFAAHADHVRQNDAVARQIGLAMTDAIIRTDADLVAVRPLIEAAAISVVQSPTFTPVVRGAVRQLHDAFTQPGAGTIVLRLADIGAVLSGVVARVAPNSAGKLPPDIDVTLAQVGDQSAARGTIAAAHRIDLLAWLLPGLAVLGLLGAAWLIGFRRRSLRPIGFAVVAAGGLILVLAGTLSVFAAAADTTALAGALRRAVLDELVGMLWWPTAVLLGTGTVLRVLAALNPKANSAPSGVDWRDWMARRPTSPQRWTVRTAGLVAVGAFAVLRPALAVSTLTVVAGLAVLVVGLSEATRVAFTLATTARRTHPARRRRRHEWIARVLPVVPILVVVGLVVLLAVPTSGSVPGAVVPAGGRGCNGYVQLCDRPYNDVAYAASHNSMSAADERGWFLAEQPTGLIGQLNAGVRVLLIDSWYGQRTSDPGQVTNAAKDKAAGLAQANADFGPSAVASALRLRNAVSGPPTGPVEPYLCHGVCDIGATKWEPVMAKVRAWLAAHPREVVTFFIEDSVSAADTAHVFQQAGLLPYVATHQVGQPWPTLGQMIDTGKRVVALMQRHGGGAAYPWLLPGWDNAQDTNYDAKSPAQLSCARNRGTAKSSLLLVNNWLNNFDAIVTDAARVNAYGSLYPRLRECQRVRGMIPNFVAVNYFSRGDLLKVVDTLNGVR